MNYLNLDKLEKSTLFWAVNHVLLKACELTPTTNNANQCWIQQVNLHALYGKHAPGTTQADRRCAHALILATKTAVFYRVELDKELNTDQICSVFENCTEK